MHSLSHIEGLTEVESLLRDSLSSYAPALTEISSHLVQLGGKRIRPVLCLLCAKALGMQSPSQELICAATGVELIHSATLLHDDIIDKSPMRRKEISAYRKFGLAGTLLAGDFLLVRAFGLCARLDAYIIAATEEACVELTEGEILETPLSKTQHTLEDALTIARKKTASLFRLSAECAAQLSGASTEVRLLMRRFGEDLGIAFQILDDVLDVAGDPKTLGKAAGIDLREQKPSIVNLLWLQKQSILSKSLCKAPPDNQDSFVEKALLELQASGVLKEASLMAQNFAENAKGSLSKALSLNGGIRDPQAYDQLLEIINFVVQRLN